MNGKKAKRLRRQARNMSQVGHPDSEYMMQTNRQLPGFRNIRLRQGCTKAIHQKLKREEA